LKGLEKMDHATRTDLHQWAGVDGDGEPVTRTVVFTDIIDSTILAGSVGDREMFDMLIHHFSQARSLSSVYNGREIKLIGDSYMAAFRTPALALQFALAFRQNTGDPRIGIRVGIHVGSVRIWEGDIYGLMVNYASRLCHIKVSGDEGIFLSLAAKKDIQSEYGKTPQDFMLSRLLPTQLQGFGREEVWQVITREMRVARAAKIAKQGKEARRDPEPAVPHVAAPPTQLPDLSGLLRRRFQNPNKH
jgi:class 3 adenylate cyclase